MPALTGEQIEQKLSTLSGWSRTGDIIRKEFSFNNFKEALAFVNKVGKLAEQANHHPDISLHNYKKVTLTLTTHSEKGLTEKDFDLAENIERT